MLSIDTQSEVPGVANLPLQVGFRPSPPTVIFSQWPPFDMKQGPDELEEAGLRSLRRMSRLLRVKRWEKKRRRRR
jgi:hypothetical protein